MCVLSETNADKIIEATFAFLEETGIRFYKDEKILKLFSEAGCEISDEGMVKFPSLLIKESLSSVPRSFKWWNREGTEFLEYGGGKTFFIADTKAPNYIDPCTGEKKIATLEASEMMVKLVDAMPEMDICGTPLTTDNFIADNAVTIINSSKPALLTSGDDPEILQATIEMSTFVRNGIKDLKEKPYFATIISPEVLHYTDVVIEQMKLCTENNVPAFIASMPIGGVSSPVTIAGTLVTCLATLLPGIVLIQLLKKGHPCVDCSFPAFMDPATAGIGGIPENTMADIARSIISRKFGLPISQQTAFAATSLECNAESIAEITWAVGKLSSYSFDSFWGAGCIDTGLTFSPHSLLYSNELASQARRIWQGVPVDSDSLAIDMIKNVEPGMFIMEEHTAQHVRSDLWQGKFSMPLTPEEKEKGLVERIESHLKSLLENHSSGNLPANLMGAIKETVEKYQK